MRDLWRRPCRIGYLGASVTAQREGYVTAFHSRLRHETGQDHTAIVAAVGGVGSISGVFLMDDLLEGRTPDLCFVEFTTTDLAGYTPLSRVGAAVEGIARKLIRRGVQPVFLHLPRIDMGEKRQPVREAYNRVASHYGIPVVDIDALWRKDAKGDGLATRLRDAVHLTDEGARDCAEHLLEGLRIIAAGPGVEAAAADRPALHHDAFDSTALIPAQPSMLEAPKRATSRVFRLNYPVLDVETMNPLRFQDERGITGALVVVGPRTGIVEARTRLGLSRHLLFDQYCHYERLNTVIFAPDQNEPREVEITLTLDPVDTSVCGRPLVPTAPSERRLSIIALMVRR